MSSVDRSISFAWCEKGLVLPTATKLMDGVGMTSVDKKERILIESSGLDDGIHTAEDTLKLLEYTAKCLQAEKASYQQAAYKTFIKRHLFAVQFVGYKITLRRSSEKTTCGRAFGKGAPLFHRGFGRYARFNFTGGQLIAEQNGS
ncbi:hypothetical protein INT45_010400 [Circinella minor]|uniref:Uncharacterized protein n=1 Tax=Circinella minor TaxID=1195481 RepID=A0A8H7RZG2_9FUNG|nr:hypothetical protein INT45_010400 [Circinella minor]